MKFSLHVTYGRGLVLLCQRCNMLCTSGLVDDVIYSRRLTGPGAGDVSKQ